MQYMLIGADLVPTKSNIELFAAGNTRELLGEELKQLLQNAQYRVFNLEVPLTDKAEPIKKAGPNLIAPVNTINAYKDMEIDLLTLANNHILDQGEQGFISTIQALDNAQIAHVGGASNLREAAKPYVFELFGKMIGVYACAEHEFTIASDSHCGANPFDLLESPDHVAALKAECDYVIVLYHGGKEHYRYPSPMLQKVCRKLVDKGANLVVCQHSHCVGCEELYHGGTIVYGQGNFVFDNEDNEFWNTSILIKVDETLQIGYIPLLKAKNGVRVAKGPLADEILKGFDVRSAEIQQPGFIEKKYASFAETMISGYLISCGGRRSILERVINRLSGGCYSRFKACVRYGKTHDVMAIRNYIECEAHRELFLEGLRERTK